ncbi:MAG: hypothetical protein R3F34_19880 [Planctomycetota bacterium]
MSVAMDPRQANAFSSARSISSVRMWLAIDQPTISRVPVNVNDRREVDRTLVCAHLRPGPRTTTTSLESAEKRLYGGSRPLRSCATNPSSSGTDAAPGRHRA